MSDKMSPIDRYREISVFDQRIWFVMWTIEVIVFSAIMVTFVRK